MKTCFVYFTLFSLIASIQFVHSHGNHSHDHDDEHDAPSNTSVVPSTTIALQAANISEKQKDDHEHHHLSIVDPTTTALSEHDEIKKTSVFHLWLYGTGAVLFISVAGLLAITTIPRIATHHHGDILQLLVGLAIGTLTSDALLHLLPHAFSGSSHEHDHNENAHHDDHGDEDHTHNVWNGLMALMGIIGFLAFERILTIVSDLSSKSHGKTTKVASCDRDTLEKGDHGHNHKEALLLPPEKEKLTASNCDADKDTVPKDSMDQVSCMKVGPDAPLTTEQCHRETMVYQHPDPDRGYVIQLMDHHHHHQHGSTTQKGAKSVIYMIVTGDGLHNFFDGLAIGIAFAGGVSGGISTSIAVLCHELPHEVGDFAVLLKAGLAAKKAVMYNTLSAFLCFIGMTVGVLAANMDTAMLSSIIAGMFIYIALVDMIPQLDCCPNATGTTRAFKLTVQLCGMGIGVLIMSIISIYEPALKRLVS